MERPDPAARQGNDEDIVRSAIVLLKALLLHLPISLLLATLARDVSILRIKASIMRVTIDDDGTLERTAIAASEQSESLFPFENVEDTHGVRLMPNRYSASYLAHQHSDGAWFASMTKQLPLPNHHGRIYLHAALYGQAESVPRRIATAAHA